MLPPFLGRKAEREQIIGKWLKEEWGVGLKMNQQELERTVLSSISPGWVFTFTAWL
jgi:hypothetical protein